MSGAGISGGVGLRNVTNVNITTVVGGGDGSDTVTVSSGTGAHGNTNLAINTGTARTP